jgi:mono/diheme cytochrome c family protein
MDFQERGEAQELNGFFPDNRAMRTPPAGTVAVGHLQDDDHLYRGLNLDGTVADQLPAGIELGDALLDRGKERFHIYCAPCHGEQGRGDGVASKRGGGMAVEPANFHQEKLQPAPLGYFFRVMTIGKGQMRPYNVQVKPEDRWAIAAWIRVLQISHRATEQDVPASALTKTARRQP